jgi:hypothetical protein
MSFSSSQWTIPELCVWLVTSRRAAVNELPSSAKDSLKYANQIHEGAYAARDDVIEAAQLGKIVVTAAGEADPWRRNPERVTLPREFWNNAEIEDAGSWQAGPDAFWCVARRLGQPAEEYRDLLVDSAKAKALRPAGGQSRPEPNAQAMEDQAAGEASEIAPAKEIAAAVASGIERIVADGRQLSKMQFKEVAHDRFGLAVQSQTIDEAWSIAAHESWRTQGGGNIKAVRRVTDWRSYFPKESQTK